MATGEKKKIVKKQTIHDTETEWNSAQQQISIEIDRGAKKKGKRRKKRNTYFQLINDTTIVP